MSTRPLVLELGALSPALVRCAWWLARDPRVSWTVRAPSSGAEPLARDVLRLESGSTLAPLLTVLWGEEGAPDVDGQALLGLNPAVWLESSPNERWRRSAAPLLSGLRHGKPARDRPWVLVAPGIDAAAGEVERRTGLRDPQLHYLLPRTAPSPGSCVGWLPTRSTLASLFGRLDAVVAPPGPLAWDAARSGVPCFELDPSSGPTSRLAERRLAHVVPEQLGAAGWFWRGLIGELLDGTCRARWGTGHWLRLARAHAARAEAGPLLGFQRKLLKLRRDPAKFVADSKRFRAVTNR